MICHLHLHLRLPTLKSITFLIPRLSEKKKDCECCVTQIKYLPTLEWVIQRQATLDGTHGQNKAEDLPVDLGKVLYHTEEARPRDP